MKRIVILLALCAGFLAAGLTVRAQYPVPNGQLFSSAQLDQLLGPIALYPDPLISEILPAATQPSQIAVAYSYVAANGDPNGIDAQPWDSSVKAVAHYPDVIKMLDSNLPWTTQLGQAFLNQPTDVMNSVQRLRSEAQAMGNLANSPQETIVDDGGVIEIEPTDPDLVYVPFYDPGVIFFQRGYGRPFLTFGVGFHLGAWLNHDFDWHDHRVVYWDRDHPRPANWWHEAPAQRRTFYAHAPVWQANHAPRAENRPAINNVGGRGDRGYAPAPRVESHPAPAPRVENNVHVDVHVTPARGGAFNGIDNAASARAASARGAISRPPAVSHAAPAHSAPSGGGGHAGGGGNGNQHH